MGIGKKIRIVLRTRIRGVEPRAGELLVDESHRCYRYTIPD